MTIPRRTIFNSLEQILSTDLNRVGDLSGKAMMDALMFVQAASILGTPRNVTLRGLDASAGAGLSVDVDPGFLAQFDVALSGDNSQFKLGALLAQTNVALPAADPVNPRVDLISAAITFADTDSSVRNVLTLPSRVVVPTAVDKTRNPSITLNASFGIPGASPAIPATPVGEVPLWYVFIPAAAVSLTDDELVDARVLFTPAALADSHARRFGFLVSTGSGGLNFVRISSGEAIVNGAPVRQDAAVEYDGTTIRPTTPGAIATDTEYQLYLVGKGSGNPVGKTSAEPFIPVLHNVAPLETGRPSAALSYRPLRGIHDELVLSSSDALYIGTMLAQTSPNFQEFSGYPMTKGGARPSFFLRGADKGVAGISAASVVLGARPRLTWGSVTTIGVTSAIFLLGGAPVNVPAQTVDITTDLVSGEVEAANTWYYIYARPRVGRASLNTSLSGIGTYVISSEAPDSAGGKPTPEAGFSSFEYKFVGSFFNDTSSDLHDFVRNGNQVLFRPHVSNGTPPGGGTNPSGVTAIAVSNAGTNVGSFVPKTSRTALFSFDINGTATFPQTVGIFYGTGNTFLSANAAYVLAVQAAADDRSLGLIAIHVDTNEQWEIATTGVGETSNATVVQNGYIEDIDDPAPQP